MLNIIFYVFYILCYNRNESKQIKEFNQAAVTTEVPRCSKLGADIMRMGGNAVDAAVASAICVGIINSFSSGLGGGGFMMIKLPGSKNEVITIDFRETAPLDIDVDSYKQKKDMSKKDGSAVAVPGELKGLHYAHSMYGKLDWSFLLEENVKIAKAFEVSHHLYRRLKKLKRFIFHDCGLKEIYTKNNELIKPGDVISRNNYANTLQELATNPESFYSGKIAEQIVKAVQKKGGKLSIEDMRRYQIKTPKPLFSTYKESVVYTTNLPTSGALLIEALNILESFDLTELQQMEKEYSIYPHYHLLVEIFKFVSAKRGELGDPDFVPGINAILENITSKEYAKKMSELIKFDKTLTKEEYGYKTPFQDDYGTTHLNVYDGNGMIVLLTSTINLEFGAKFMDEQTGIIFNNEIDDFYVPTVRNAFDLPASIANIVMPGKRPFSSAAPILIINQNKIIALGAAGGSRIPTSIISVIFHLEMGKTLQEAISEPRLHHQMIPHITYVEHNLNDAVKKYLRTIGNTVETSSLNSIFTSVQGMIIKKSQKITIEAYSDKRKGGESFGY